MRTIIALVAIAVALTLGGCVRATLPTAPAVGDVQVLDDQGAAGALSHLQAVDFEDLPLDRGPGLPTGLRNPLTLGAATFRNPVSLRDGFCSSPTCQPDANNPDGGNIELFLEPGGSISFAQPARMVILDIQGIGDNPFVLVVTERGGRQKTIASEGKLFGVTLVGVTAPRGITSVEVQGVGGTGGPLALARVLFSRGSDSAT